MRAHRRRRRFWLALTLQLALACACGRPSSDPAVLPAVRVAVGRSAPNARLVPLYGPPHLWIADFELRGDTLDLLDPTTPSINRYIQEPDGSWQLSRFIVPTGRDSAAFRTARGMTSIGDTLVVIGADATMWTLDGDGRLVRSAQASLGCSPRLPSVVVQRNGGILIAGECLDADQVMREVLWHGDSAGRFSRVAAEVRYSADGARGYVFASPRALTATSDGALFGIGVTNCLWELDVSAPSSPRSRCPLVRFAYLAGDPGNTGARSLAEFRRRHHATGPAFEWHQQLPLYVDHIQIGATIVLARRAAGDTLVLLPADAEAEDAPLLSGPAGTFVGCKRSGCLWFRPGDGTDSVAVVTTARLHLLLNHRSRGGG